MPKTSAPNGRAARVSVLATTTAERSAWKSLAMALNMKTIRKKSKASSVQPRKLAATALHWWRSSPRSSDKVVIA